MVMPSVSKHLRLLAAVLAVALAGHAANARTPHTRAPHIGRAYVAPAAPAGAYGAYDAYGPRGTRAEEFYGSSVPYDPDGPGWNDFQLQGTN
jgi:hypothetical protein